LGSKSSGGTVDTGFFVSDPKLLFAVYPRSKQHVLGPLETKT